MNDKPANDAAPADENEPVNLKFGQWADYYRKSIGFATPPAQEVCDHEWRFVDSRDFFYCVHCQKWDAAE